MPSVPLAASRVSLVLERVSTPGVWIRTGDVQRFRVRLNGMADGVKVAIAASPAAALTQVSCASAAPGTPFAPAPAAEAGLGAARGGVRAARALAAQALSVTGGSVLPSAVPPGTRVCELGDLAGEREVDVTLTTPSGAKQVVLAAVAGMRADAGGPLTTKTKTAATRVMDEEAGFSGPAVRVSPEEPLPGVPGAAPGKSREYAEAKERLLAQLQQPAPPARAWAKVQADAEAPEVAGAQARRRLLAGAGVLLEGQWPAEAAAPRREAAGGTARRLKGGVPQAPRQPQMMPQWPQGAPGLELPQAAPQAPGLAQAVPQLPPGLQRLPQAVPQLPQGLQRLPQAAPQLPQGLPQLPQGLPQVPQLPQGLPQAPQGLQRLPEAVPQPVPGAPPALVLPGASPSLGGAPLLPGMAAPQAAPGAAGQPARGAEGVVPLPWNVAAARKHARPVAWASPLDGPKGLPVVAGSIGALLGALWLIGTVQRRRKSKT
ncbi:hypothetical protein ACIHFD_52105 [Nonomuraea sp. NPDC051941]|uniref:hypothetical protein n=1 Tax=Nonomuraea sp. NPDC051941 TaxID=3364373 RepID=UPI0037C633FA